MFNEARPGWKENPLRTGRKKESLFCNSPQFFIGAPSLPSPPGPAKVGERGGGGRGERGEGVTRHQKEVSKKPSEWRERGGENTSLRERGEEEGPSSPPLSPPDKSQPRPPPSPGLLRLSSLSILPSPLPPSLLSWRFFFLSSDSAPGGGGPCGPTPNKRAAAERPRQGQQQGVVP